MYFGCQCYATHAYGHETVTKPPPTASRPPSPLPFFWPPLGGPIFLLLICPSRICGGGSATHSRYDPPNYYPPSRQHRSASDRRHWPEATTFTAGSLPFRYWLRLSTSSPEAPKKKRHPRGLIKRMTRVSQKKPREAFEKSLVHDPGMLAGEAEHHYIESSWVRSSIWTRPSRNFLLTDSSKPDAQHSDRPWGQDE